MPAVAGADDSLIGNILADKYRVVRQIGRGGMGVVYEAEHIGLGKRVAVKLMLEKYAEDTEAIARFQREALAASRIGNPHIIDVSDIGVAPDGRSFVVMELLSGAPLSHLLEVSGPLPPWRAVDIMRQVLRAVGAAHGKGIIHRDLKPDNIFLVNNGEDGSDFIKLLDFGISKVVDLDEQVALTKLTTTGVVMGTPLYMAPEQAMGNPIDRFADLYACGVILYELLAGKPPFEGATYAVLVAKVLTAPPPNLGDVRPGLPDKLVRAVHRALEKEPTARFQSAEHFAAAMPSSGTPSLHDFAGTTHGGMAVSPRAKPPARTGLAALAAFIVAAAATAVFVMMQGGSNPARPEPGGTPVTTPEPPPLVPVDPPAPSATGTLEIQSIPAGASVLIDGKPIGNTPIAVTLPAGIHRVRVELAGHVGIEMDQTVQAAKQMSVVVPLQKAVAGAPERPSTVKRPARPGGKKPGGKKPGGTRPAPPENPYSTGPAADDTPRPPPPRPRPEPRPTGKPGGTKPNPY